MREDLARRRPAEVVRTEPLAPVAHRPAGRISYAHQQALTARAVHARQVERAKNRRLIFIGFGVTLALGVLGVVAWIVWSIYRAGQEAASWVGSHGEMLLGGLFVLGVVLFGIGKLFGGGGTFTFSGTGRWK